MSAALRLVRDDGNDGSDLPPLDGWEVFMRGAGLAERTVLDRVAVMRLLERHADKDCTQIRAVDVSRFLANPKLGSASRASYFGSIHAFYKWWASRTAIMPPRSCHDRRCPRDLRARCQILDSGNCWRCGCTTAPA